MKIYCINKLDRALKENASRAKRDPAAKFKSISEEGHEKLQDIIKKLDSYIDMISANLSHKIADILASCSFTVSGTEGRAGSVNKGYVSGGGGNCLARSEISYNSSNKGFESSRTSKFGKSAVIPFDAKGIDKSPSKSLGLFENLCEE